MSTGQIDDDTTAATRLFGIRHWSVLALVFALSASTTDAQPRWNPSIPSIPSTNLIPNSSFELGADGWSSLGTPTAGGGDLCGLYGDIQFGDAYEGNHCLRIELEPGKTPITHSDYSLGASRTVVQAAPRAATLGWMEVTVGQSYTLSAYMRADRDGVPADLLFRFGGDINTRFGNDTHTRRVELSREWARYTFSMTATHPDVYIAVGPNLLGTPDASATVWIDAVQLEATPPVITNEAETSAHATAYVPRESIEIGINSGRYGNLFEVDAPVEFMLAGTNTTAAPALVEIRVELEDYFGDRSAATTGTLTIPAGETATGILPLHVPGTGYYRAHLRWETGGITHTRTIKFSVVDTYETGESAFGLNHLPTTAAASTQLRKCGITWARDWSMKWESIEPVEGTYDFAEIDRQVDRIVDLDMRVLPILPPQPSAAWASEAPEDIERAVERTAYAPAPEHRNKLNAFIGATVARYRDRVRYWEFLNEPLWVPWYCLPTEGGYTVDTYIDLLKGAANAMKTADPDCIVIGGISVMAHSALGDEFIEKGGLEFVDIYNLHPYPEGDGPESFVPWMERIQTAMEAQGRPIPIWATELSYWATDDKPWTPWAPPNPNHWAANRQQATEREAADYNIRQAIILLAHGVEKIFWHSGLEGEVNNGVNDLENPLLDPEAVPQKFFAALAMLANCVGPSPTFVASLDKPAAVDGQDTERVHGYSFNGPKGAVLIVWSPGINNNSMRGPNGHIPLGESPVYLVASTMTAGALAQAVELVPHAGTGKDGTETTGWAVQIPPGVEPFTVVGSPMPPNGEME